MRCVRSRHIGPAVAFLVVWADIVATEAAEPRKNSSSLGAAIVGSRPVSNGRHGYADSASRARDGHKVPEVDNIFLVVFAVKPGHVAAGGRTPG